MAVVRVSSILFRLIRRHLSPVHMRVSPRQIATRLAITSQEHDKSDGISKLILELENPLDM
jgi:hypothetical protein